ncbi:MAG: RDD family protein [Actinomycetes bacterium]
MTDTSSGGTAYPGQRLGLPQSGPRSVASWLRRGLALFVDWVASSLVAGIFFGYEWFGATAGQQGWAAVSPILVLLVEASVLTALLGGSFGQLALRIVVVRVDGRPVNLLQALGRTALICLVIPPLIFNRDNRGLHDLAFGTIALNR